VDDDDDIDQSIAVWNWKKQEVLRCDEGILRRSLARSLVLHDDAETAQELCRSRKEEAKNGEARRAPTAERADDETTKREEVKRACDRQPASDGRGQR